MLGRILETRRGVTLLVIVAMAAGIGLVTRIAVKLYPDTTKPALAVILPHPGYTATDFRSEYGEQVERALSAVRDVETVEGAYGAGQTRFRVEFAWNVENDVAKNRVTTAMASVRSTLPRESRDHQVLFWSAGNAGFMAVAAYSPKLTSAEIYESIQPVLDHPLSRIEDAEQVEIVKAEELNAEIIIDHDRLLAYGLMLDEVVAAVRSGYEAVSVGSFNKGQSTTSVRMAAEVDSVFDIGEITVGRIGTTAVTLADVAEVSVGYDLPQLVFRANGARSVLIFATPADGGNVKRMSDEVRAAINAHRDSLPEDLSFDYLVDPAAFINEAVWSVISAALVGIAFALLVIVLLLGEPRNILLVALSIPLAVVLSFILMYLFGLSLNLVSLAGLTLSVGMIIDSSIVVMENIHRHRLEVAPGDEAALKAAILMAVRQVRGAIIAATLTSILVFLPLSFTSPLADAILGNLALTVVFALSCSLLVALVVLPPAAFYVFRREAARNGSDGPSGGPGVLQRISETILGSLTRAYRRVLSALLRSRPASRLFMGASFVALVLVVALVVPRVPTEILAKPESDMLVLWFMKYDSRSKDQLLADIAPMEEEIFSRHGSDIESLLVQIAQPNSGIFIIGFDSAGARRRVEAQLREAYSSTEEWRYRVFPWDPSELPLPSTHDLQLRVHGPDAVTAARVLGEVATAVRDGGFYENVYTSPPTTLTQELNLVPRHAEIAALEGLSPARLASIARTVMSGAQVIDMSEGGESVQVRLEYPDDYISSSEDLSNLLVSYRGKGVPLKHFFDIEARQAVSELVTRDGRETFNLYGTLSEDTPAHRRAELEAQAMDLIEQKVHIPDGYRISAEDGRSEVDRAIRSLVVALGASLILVYLVIGVQFNSALVPLLVLVNVPPGFIGVVLSLHLFNSTISLNSMLGTILLGGIVVNNAIIMIDFYRRVRHDFTDRVEALVHAAALRLPPILITMATTVLAMLPLALGVGDATNIIQPLGVAVAGGLLVSTLFTLFMVPCLLNMGARSGSRE